MKFDPELYKATVLFSSKINASSDMVWDVISAPGNLIYCHPFCKDNPVIKWGGVGAQDTIIYYNGLILNRVFTVWDEGKGYELLIGSKSIATAKVIWEITSVNKDKSELSITIITFPDIALKRYLKPFRKLIEKGYFLPNMAKYGYSC